MTPTLASCPLGQPCMAPLHDAVGWSILAVAFVLAVGLAGALLAMWCKKP